MNSMKALISALVCVWCTSASADWADPHAEYECDPRTATFSMRSTMETSSPDKGTVPERPGYTEVKNDAKILCMLPGARVEIAAEVVEPNAHMCGGFTHTYLTSIRINGRQFKPVPLSFNSSCLDPDLYLLDIQQMGKRTTLHMCYASWDWGAGYKEDRCEDKDF